MDSSNIGFKVGEEQKILAQNLRKVSSILNTYNNMRNNEEMKKIAEKVRYYKNNDNNFYSSEKNGFWLFCNILMFFASPICFIYSIVSNIEIGNNTMASLLMVTSIILLPSAIFSTIMCRKVAKENAIAKMPDYEKKLEDFANKCSAILSDEFWTLLENVPPSYRYQFAIDKLADYFENGRAESMKEAINLFEEEKHRTELEDMQRQQIAQMEQIRRSANSIKTSSGISAAANVLDLFF